MRTYFILFTFVFFILIGILTTVQLLNKPTNLRSKASETTSSRYCAVTDTLSLKDCFQKVLTNTVDFVEVKNLITCSGDQACAVSLPNITNRPVYIFGTPNSNVGFKRLDSFKYYIFNISSSSNISFVNLHFDENVLATCAYPTGGCVSPITISNSSNLYLDNLKIEYSKVMGIEISNSKEVTIQNSTISYSSVFGIWSSQNISTRYLHNNFNDTKSNAILFESSSPIDKPSIIAGNTFTHNHRDAIFNSCNGPCGGGQLLVSNSSNVIIENNTIINGKIETYPMIPSSGIEFSLPLTNIQIKRNSIHNNTGWGIVVNGSSLTPNNVTIDQNMLYSNNAGNIVFPNAVQGNNCFSTYCNFKTEIVGIISSSPYPCFLSGSTQCSSTISWTTSNAALPALKKDSTIIATDLSGSSSQPITSTGTRFELYDGMSLLNTLYDIAVPMSSPLSPTIVPTNMPTTVLSLTTVPTIAPTVVSSSLSPTPTLSPLCPKGSLCRTPINCLKTKGIATNISCGLNMFCCTKK